MKSVKDEQGKDTKMKESLPGERRKERKRNKQEKAKREGIKDN